MIKKTLTLLAVLIFANEINSQELLTPSFAFSHKKTAYITLTDGTELTGTIKDLDRDKGLIEEVKLKDNAGKKHKLEPEDIAFMYLPPSGLDNLSKKIGFLDDARKWNDEKLNQDFLEEGYIYFELAEVKMKKKNKKLLMQLLNPGYSKVVKVYHDPKAKKTMSIGVGPLKAGGLAKSYYLAKGNNPAYKLQKKEYKEEFVPMWSSCDKVMKEYKDQKWSNFAKHVLAFSECSE